MSENSSDSESSCGWTIINHEGSDIETLPPESGGAGFPLEQRTPFVEDLPPDSPTALRGTSAAETDLPVVENIHSAPEEHPPAPEEPSGWGTKDGGEEGVLGDDGHGETVSDDSDIVTLEPPKPDEGETPEEEDVPEAEDNEMNMSFSSSSQYTFSHPESAYPSRHSADDSSNDEASDVCGPVFRRRRSKRSASSGPDSESKPPPDPQEVRPEPRRRKRTGSHLNRCIVLALAVAVSMGFGHFYGTVQILERQKHAEKIHEHEISDMMGDLVQCQREHGATLDQKGFVEPLAEDLEENGDFVESQEGFVDKTANENKLLEEEHAELEANDLTTSLRSSVVQNTDLVLENRHLRESLEKEELALSSLKEELRKLREQIRNLEEKGRPETFQSENQKLKEHLKEERQKIRSFRTQKEALLTEAKFLRKELDNERQITDSLRAELEEIGKMRSTETATDDAASNKEIEHLKSRLSELEKKLNFEQQRSDLWERLYVEAKEQNEKSATGGQSHDRPSHDRQSHDRPSHDRPSHDRPSHDRQESTQSAHRKKGKGTFFNSVKDTFDAMKNSTKEFVRHHKEKIKQAKEAVKENLKKFSDSVKTTFKHFKDSTRNMFDKNRFKKPGERRREESKSAYAARRAHKPCPDQYPDQATTARTYSDSHEDRHTEDFNDGASQHLKGCSGVFECAHQESISLFNKVLDPIRVEEFHDLMQVYLLEQVHHFRHWKELEEFINKFFHNGVFIHDQMLFTDFVNDVEDYLEDIKEYQTNTGGVFQDLDEFVYRHFFGSPYSIPYGPRKPERAPLTKERKPEEKQRARYRREGKWQKHGRATGRHVANVEIELAQLPFDPKY